MRIRWKQREASSVYEVYGRKEIEKKAKAGRKVRKTLLRWRTEAWKTHGA